MIKGRVNGGRVLVKEIKKDEKVGAIILPGSDQDPTFRGKVIAVGNGVLGETGLKLPMDIEVGEICHYRHFSGAPIVIGSEEYLVLNIGDILFIETKEEA